MSKPGYLGIWNIDNGSANTYFDDFGGGGF